MSEEIDFDKLARLLADKEWRIRNLYSIHDRNGQVRHFRPNVSQEWFFQDRHLWTLLTKSRQHGFSTAAAIDYADDCIFTPNIRVGLIDKKIEDAKEKLEKVRFAYETIGINCPGLTIEEGLELNRLLHAEFPLEASKAERIKWKNGSQFSCSTSYRGGTLQRLWVSEFGYIAIHRPKDAEKILSGALPAVAPGNKVLFESTHEGGKYGSHYRLMTEAMGRESPAEQEFKFLFIPFQSNPDNRMAVTEYTFRDEEQRVFDEWEKDGIYLDIQQKAFWANQYRTLPRFAAFREFPARPEDMFRSPVEGAFYAEVLTSREVAGAVGDFPIESRWPAYVSWDLGQRDAMALWLVQVTPTEFRWIDYYQAQFQHISHFVRHVEHWGHMVPIRKNLMPHDADSTEKHGRSFKEEALQAGLENVVTVPRCRSVFPGIDELRSIFEISRFHTRVKEGFELGAKQVSGWEFLQQYRIEDAPDGSTLQRLPRHDHTSHCADAGRTLAEARMNGLLSQALPVSQVEEPVQVLRN